MKKLILLWAVLFSIPAFAQEEEDLAEAEASSVVDGIVAKQHIVNARPIRPAYVREANVLWSKTIWRMVDLREKENLYLYFPLRPIDDRRSLVKVLYDGIMKGELDAYSTSTDNEFERTITAREAAEALGGQDPDSLQEVNPETGEMEWRYIFSTDAIHFDAVKKFLFKEVWFFDKKYSMLKVRIIGLCPIIEDMNEEGTRMQQKQAFWVYYPQAEPLLAKQEAFTFRNDAQRQSLHAMLEKRLFGSYVFRESNVYDNRVIQVYAQGMSANIEAERIQNSIFQKEHDMWEF